MGNIEATKVTLSLEIDEFYALQDIVAQWYRDNRLKYNGFEEHILIKVANDIRNIRPIDINGALTIN